MKKTVHIISHSHWDREWYMPFENHRMYLIRLIDTCMDLFETDPGFRSFTLDGQTIVLDDYLQIRPQKKEQLLRYIREGRFLIGPWYILQDEFLTSGEANVRNLLAGKRRVLEYGGRFTDAVGYFPDAFGNAGQMPQLLRQAGIKAIAFGRGVKPVGADNRLKESGQYTSAYSEMLWQSPNGSALPAILFANWYNNGAEIPEKPEEAKPWWEERLAQAEAYAGTDQLLFLNGCDHQPVQQNLSQAIRTAEALFPEITFLHSDFPTYVKAITGKQDHQLSCVTGELTSQETDGCWTLVHTASAHIDLKIRNRRNELALEHAAEPLSAMAYLQGAVYPEDELHYAWEKLMQNHPHDSICCCSTDAVIKEMDVRFDKSLQVAEHLIASAKDFMAGGLAKSVKEPVLAAFTVFHTGGHGKKELVTVTLDLDRCWETALPEAYRKMEEAILPSMRLVNSHQEIVEAVIQDAGVGFGFTLPRDRFRRKYMARRIRVQLEAEVPALGYETYFLVQTDTQPEADSSWPAGEQSKDAVGSVSAQESTLRTGERSMENAFLKVEIADNGNICLTEKTSGRCYPQLLWYEDTGDCGNEYLYIAAKNSAPITTLQQKAEIQVKEDDAMHCCFAIRQVLQIPASGDALLMQEREQMADYYERRSGRGETLTELTILTEVTLAKSAKGITINTTVKNDARDHRLRVMLPLKIQNDYHLADSLFEVVKRPNHPGPAWKNPSVCQRAQQFVALEDDQGGVVVSNLGLYEYEIQPGPKQQTLALTLLRCVGEMGDWGVFPTQSSQMQGTYTCSFGITPFAAGQIHEAMILGRQFQEALEIVQLPLGACRDMPPWEQRYFPEPTAPSLPLRDTYLRWKGAGLHLTACKKAEGGEALILRWVNDLFTETQLEIRKMPWMQEVFFSSVTEEELDRLQPEDGCYRIPIKPQEIITIKCTGVAAANGN